MNKNQSFEEQERHRKESQSRLRAMGTSLEEVIKQHEQLFPISAADAQHCTRTQYEQAYALFEQGWTIPDVAKQLGVPHAIVEKISEFQLHESAVGPHDPANCPWCRERMA